MRIRTILVATDFSESARAALECGQLFAGAFGASLHVLHVVTQLVHEPWSGYVPAASLLAEVDRLQHDAHQRLAELVPGDSGAVLATAWGDATDETLDYARRHDVDVIVCGTHGRCGWDRVVMGSVAERIVRFAPCPVLTVHASASTAVAA